MIKNLLDDEEEPREEPEHGGRTLSHLFSTEPTVTTLFSNEPAEPGPANAEAEGPDSITRPAYTPPTTDESIRMTGLAWSAGITLFASIVFMMLFGWFADLLFGSSPWGLVGGMVLGSIIGFVQFFRINQEILRTPRKKG